MTCNVFSGTLNPTQSIKVNTLQGFLRFSSHTHARRGLRQHESRMSASLRFASQQRCG